MSRSGAGLAPRAATNDTLFMKKTILATLLLLGAVASRAQVRFEALSTDALRERAMKSGKLVFIELHADWCPPCRVMEREVFSDREVGEFFERHFVAARYDTDRRTGRALMKRYGSGAIPLGLVFDTRAICWGASRVQRRRRSTSTTCARSLPAGAATGNSPIGAGPPAKPHHPASNRMHHAEIHRSEHTSRQSAKQPLIKGKQDPIPDNGHAPKPEGKTKQRRGNDGKPASDNKALPDMKQKVHAECKIESQPRMDQIRPGG